MNKDFLFLDLFNPYDENIIVESIDGLGPQKADVNLIERAMIDGADYNSSQISTRNIVFHLRLLEDSETKLIETTRNKTYEYFKEKEFVTILIDTDHGIYKTEGVVESVDPDIFSNAETETISVICPDPYLYNYIDNISRISNPIPKFEFPFECDNSINKEEFGEIIYIDSNDKHYIPTTIINNGSVESGCHIIITIDDNISSDINLINLSTNENMNININKINELIADFTNFIKDDIIEISTFPGNKYINFIRNNISYNIRYSLPKLTDWISLKVGENNILLYGNNSIKKINIKITYNEKYYGV